MNMKPRGICGFGCSPYEKSKYIQLSATDVLVPTTMKNAAKCDT